MKQNDLIIKLNNGTLEQDVKKLSVKDIEQILEYAIKVENNCNNKTDINKCSYFIGRFSELWFYAFKKQVLDKLDKYQN